jgi:uncharacterized phage protein (TIGR02218 family)
MKTIPVVLQTHKELPTTTLCRLMKIRCKDGTFFGFANLDIDVTYDDDAGSGSPSDGPIVYRSINGFTPSRLSMAAGTTVDNSDLRGIVAEVEALGITAEQVRAGLLDYADAWVYQVNYRDLTTGRHEIMARGKCGRVSMRDDEFISEFRSLTQLFKQPIGKVTSLTCRAQFGDAECQKPLDWITATITSVSGEPDRIFTASSLAQAATYFAPGVVRVTSGDNVGQEFEVEAFALGGIITLSLPAYFAFAVNDTIDIRQDCSKEFDDASHGCLYHWAADRVLYFRGEPLIPVGQEGSLSTPGAEI